MAGVLPFERLHDLFRKASGRLAPHSLREQTGLLEDELAVHQHQRLLGSRAGTAAFAVDGHHWGVECGQERNRLGPPRLQVDAPPRLVVFHHDLADEIFFHGDRRTKERAIELAAGNENSVPQSFRIQPADGEAAVEGVFDVGVRCCIPPGRLAIDR